MDVKKSSAGVHTAGPGSPTEPLSPRTPGRPTAPLCPVVPAGPGGPSGPWRRGVTVSGCQKCESDKKVLHFILPEDRLLLVLPSLRGFLLVPAVRSLPDVPERRFLLRPQEGPSFQERLRGRRLQSHPETQISFGFCSDYCRVKKPNIRVSNSQVNLEVQLFQAVQENRETPVWRSRSDYDVLWAS